MDNKTISQDKYVCKNCETEFHGKFCPQCGQSIKEFERPLWFLIIDLTGNIFAFDTRLWETLIAILFRPGKLAYDYVKGHRVRYMPPFRFYIFVSFIFFLMLNFYTSRSIKRNTDNNSKATITCYTDSVLYNAGDTLIIGDKLQEESKENIGGSIAKTFLKEHPELFFEKLLTNLSWAMFFLMPFYAFLLWLFFRRAQRYYITHLILAINQHAFMFIVLFVVFLLGFLLPDFSSAFRNYLLILIPVYFVSGYKNLYKQKLRKTILKFIAVGVVYSVVVLTVSVGLIVLVAVENGIV